jgi:acyl transferase domain-containing protein
MSSGARTLQCNMYSSVTGQRMRPGQVTPCYWKDNMTSTVQFEAALTECLKNHTGDCLLLEIGPHPALKGPTKEILQFEKNAPAEYFHTLFRQRNDMEALLENVGGMIAAGVPVRRRNVNGKEIVDGLNCTYEYGPVLKNLPTYQWDHSTSIWYEARTSRNQRFRRFPRHELLGSRYLEDSPLNPTWRSLPVLDQIPWLATLKVKQVFTSDSATDRANRTKV